MPRPIGELGTRFESDRISLKPWPSRRTLHRTITAVIDLMTAAGLHFDDIDHVEVMVGPITRPWCQPMHEGMVPDQRIDLLNNMLFAVGAAIRYRDSPLGHPDRPLSDAQLHAKFRECGKNAIRPPDPARMETIIATVMSLETLQDVASLSELLQ